MSAPRLVQALGVGLIAASVFALIAVHTPPRVQCYWLQVHANPGAFGEGPVEFLGEVRVCRPDITRGPLGEPAAAGWLVHDGRTYHFALATAPGLAEEATRR